MNQKIMGQYNNGYHDKYVKIRFNSDDNVLLKM